MYGTVSLRILVVLTVTFFTVEAHRVYHRIHVPTKIKTIYHTKIIKVPEHHHYIHEKEKIVPVETHHHHSHHSSHKSSSFIHDDDSFEYEQASSDSYHPIEEKFHPIEDKYEFETVKTDHDFLVSESKKRPKIHKKHRARPRRIKHKIIKLPPN